LVRKFFDSKWEWTIIKAFNILKKAPPRKYSLRDRATLKPRTYRFPSDYSQVEVIEPKDDEEEQIKRATEMSLREYHRKNYDVTKLINKTGNLNRSYLKSTFFKFESDEIIEDPFLDSNDKPSDSDEFNSTEPIIKRSEYEQKVIDKNSVVSDLKLYYFIYLFIIIFFPRFKGWNRTKFLSSYLYCKTFRSIFRFWPLRFRYLQCKK